jgi:hypothetical protein
MNLENYISQLLYRYQCVTVPGFGAFLTEIQSAQHIAQTNSFNPPKKLVFFNPLVKNNDGLLANHIIKTERISYQSAVNYINFEVENWNAKLEEFGQFSIKNVGDFYLNADNKIVFEPYEKVNYLTTSFGLNAFNSPIVKRNLFEDVIENTPIPEISASTEIKETPVIPIQYQRVARTPYLKYAAVLLLSGGLGVAGANNLYNRDLAQQELAINQKVQKQIDNKIQTATFFISNPLENVKAEKVVAKLNYHIVAGVYKSQENAQKVVDKLKVSGYAAKVLPVNKNGLFPVIYSSFATYDEAKIAEYDIEKKQNTSVWILTQEL